jgi:hypothetical protein
LRIVGWTDLANLESVERVRYAAATGARLHIASVRRHQYARHAVCA